MADLATVMQTVIRTLHLDSETVGSLATADVKREIIDAMEYYSTEAPWFLIEDMRITLSSGVEKYNLGDFLENVHPRVRYIPDITATDEVRYPMQFVSFDRLRNNIDYTNDIGSGSEVITSPFPRFCAVEPGTQFLWVSPKPDGSNTAIELKVTRQKQVPLYSYSASTWTFTEPDGVGSLGDTFENFWLKYAQKLIEYRAIAQLLIGPYGGSEASESKAAVYKQLEQQELNRLRSRSNRKNPVYSVPKDI